MPNSITILLGAGFSVPMGYPDGNKLNEALLSCDGSDFAFHTNGQLARTIDGKKPNFGYATGYDIEFSFCRKLILYFKESRGYFDYEEFYDFILEQALNESVVNEMAAAYKGTYGDTKHLLFKMQNIYNQLVFDYIKDREGNRYYDNAADMGKPYFPGYTGVLNCIEELAKQNTVNIHTLNHDLFFERLNITQWLKGELCDGFEELGSPYYGQLITDKSEYKVRLEKYTGNYNKRYRLYKLHGSLNYAMYYQSHGNAAYSDGYVKTKYGINVSSLYKEITNPDGKLVYDYCFFNYHPDFLVGTTSKIQRYKEPFLFKILFEHFKKNLTDASILLIIGYGGKDSEVNAILKEHYNYTSKPVYIIAPYPSTKLRELATGLNGKIIQKHLEELKITDIS